MSVTACEASFYREQLLKLHGNATVGQLENRLVNQDLFGLLDYLPDGFVDLLFLDPPYNLTKTFNGLTFRGTTTEAYAEWLETWLPKLLRILKTTATVYICADWRSSTPVHLVAGKYLTIRNRITWEREKGRGARANWKNNSEDIWFCTMSDDYTFDAESVKLRRKVIAPYSDENGDPKDWSRTDDGNYRLTCPSNLWTDLTVPFWSMPENTDHPTQKPEKLLAKLVLASTRPNDLVFDPFCGSGTCAVVAKKLGRRYLGVEINEMYCCLAQKRLALAEDDKSIQGFSDGVFWERNSQQGHARPAIRRQGSHDLTLFRAGRTEDI